MGVDESIAVRNPSKQTKKSRSESYGPPPTERQEAKCTGYVQWFDDGKGFGFIKNNDGSGDLFVHQSEIYCDGFRSLAENEKVEFEIEDRGNGKYLRAINVTGPGGAFCIGKDKKTIIN